LRAPLSLSCYLFRFFFTIPPPPRSTLFPYTTLFRSLQWNRPHGAQVGSHVLAGRAVAAGGAADESAAVVAQADGKAIELGLGREDRKSTRLNSSHVKISYAVFCLKKKKKKGVRHRTQ